MSSPKKYITVDAVVFGYEEGNLSLLLVKRGIEPFKGRWALPGGFVNDNESLENAVERELNEEAGITLKYLEQLYTFGEPSRDPRGRVISVAYLGLVRPDAFELSASTDVIEADWFNINDLPKLAFDHKSIIDKALERLRAKITYQPIGFELLNTTFSFSELERLYSSLLGRPIDRRNFRKKIMSFGLLTQLSEKRKEGPGRPASLFQFDEDRYKTYLEKGLYFEL